MSARSSADKKHDTCDIPRFQAFFDQDFFDDGGPFFRMIVGGICFADIVKQRRPEQYMFVFELPVKLCA